MQTLRDESVAHAPSLLTRTLVWVVLIMTVSVRKHVLQLFELGDTVLIVLRKRWVRSQQCLAGRMYYFESLRYCVMVFVFRPLQVLQYYHHWATMLFVW